VRRAEIDLQNRMMLERQRQFRAAADTLVDAWAAFSEVQAVAVIGSVAKPLWKEVSRFGGFRRQHIEVWHECSDLDLALWLDSQERLGDLRRAASHALLRAYERGTGAGIVTEQLDIFLFAARSEQYLGRLCRYNECPKGKPQCFVPGCGTVPFNKRVAEFEPGADLLAAVSYSTLYERGSGRLRSALDLPTVDSGA
jgi:hypothetical protein